MRDSGKHSLVRLVLLAGVSVIGMTGTAQARGATRYFNIPDQAAVSAIPEFAREAGVQIIVPADAVEGKHAHSLKGNYLIREGLDRLIAGLGVEVRHDDGHTIVLGNAQSVGVPSGNDRLADNRAIRPVKFTPAPQTASTPQGARSAPATDAGSSANPDPGNDIIVTAQHVKENLQKTPIAMSVYTGTALRENAVTGIAGLSAIAPDINFSSNQGSPTITIRGISSFDVTENGDPAVTVNFDGFYLNRPYSLNAAMYDIERVEVLRGPQGTLNGRNSVGGAINLVTAKPVDELKGYTSLSVGNYNAISSEGMINIPISDGLQVRASFLTDNHDGYRHNAPQPNADDSDSKSGRLSVAFQPSSNFHGLVTFEIAKEGGFGDAVENISYMYTPAGALIHDLPSGINSKTFTTATAPSLDLTEKQVRYNLVYSLPGFDLTALGGYDETSWHHNTDFSSVANAPQIQTFSQNEFPKTVNAELRATSRTSSPFQWQAGLFYFGEHSTVESYQATPLVGGGLDKFLAFIYKTHSASKAAYVQASYKITDALKITAGTRYTTDIKAESGYYGDLTVGPSTYVYADGRSSSSKVTYHAAVDYDATASNFLYAKVDTGYKAGGFNFGAPSYAPETLISYEIGSKNRFFDRALQLNIAAFYSNFTNQQVGTYVYLPNGFANAYTENAGASRVYGVETDLIAKIPVIGTFTANIDYLHARYTDFVSIADPSDPALTGLNVQLKGNRVPQSPTLSLQLALEHQWHVLKGVLTGRVQTKYQSASNFSFYNYADTAQGAYTMSNLFLSYAPQHGDWKLSAYVKNVENSQPFSTAQENAYAFAYSYQFYPPRTFGFRLEKSW